MGPGQLRKRLNTMNLDVKLRLYITVMIIGITIIMLIVSTGFTVHSLFRKSEQAAESNLAFVAQSYSDWLERNKELLMALQMDETIQQFCTYKKADGTAYFHSRKSVKENIENQINQNQDINFLSVTNEELGAYIYSGNHSITNTRFEDAYKKGMVQSHRAKRYGSILVNFGSDFFGGSKYSVTFYQPIYSTNQLDTKIGMLCLNVNDSLLKSMEESLNIPSSQTYVTDADGMLVSDKTKSVVEGKSDPFSFAGKQRGYVCQDGVYYYFQKLAGWNYYVVSAVPTRDLYSSSLETAVILILVMVVILTGSVIMIRKMVTKNYEQVSKVVHAMDHISNNDLKYRINSEDMSEDFHKLSDGFNHMAEEINGLMVTVRNEQHQMDQIRFNALQSQIQPHFLYNTLECIHWQSRAEGDKKVSKLIMALASYYRLALSKGRDIITLKQELEHIRYYLLIQNQRYGDMISYEIKVEEEFFEVKIPKLTLQPLVENSIYHGIRVKEGLKGKILITARQEKENVILEVSDSGEGMSEEQIKEMNQSISEYNEEFGYGVCNVNKRIELKFGKQYGLTYKMNEQRGVTVEISLPLQYEEENTSILGE